MNNNQLARVFAALSDPGRLQMFKLLFKKKDLCVTDIANEFGISVPAASQHLKVLEQSGLASRERDGQKICYKLNEKEETIELISKVISS